MNPHLEVPLAWFGDEPSAQGLGVVLLHGRTQSPGAMKGLVVDRLALGRVTWAAPTAAGQSWYPKGFLAERVENEPSLIQALEAVRATCDALASRGVPLHRQVVLGFSQGACLAAEFLYRTRLRPAALVALTGGLIGPGGTTWAVEPSTWAGMPVVLGGSAEDAWVPAWRMEETAKVFASGGAEVACPFFPGNAHEVPDAQVAATRALLTSLGAR
jgi:predicted esterase